MRAPVTWNFEFPPTTARKSASSICRTSSTWSLSRAGRIPTPRASVEGVNDVFPGRGPVEGGKA
eukprot:13399250-Heterocapsa_arctica.AAC.1